MSVPKKNVSAYIHFINMNIETYKENNLGTEMLSYMLINDWDSLNNFDKFMYKDIADKDKVRYDKELLEYMKVNPDYKPSISSDDTFDDDDDFEDNGDYSIDCLVNIVKELKLELKMERMKLHKVLNK